MKLLQKRVNIRKVFDMFLEDLKCSFCLTYNKRLFGLKYTKKCGLFKNIVKIEFIVN